MFNSGCVANPFVRYSQLTTAHLKGSSASVFLPCCSVLISGETFTPAVDAPGAAEVAPVGGFRLRLLGSSFKSSCFRPADAYFGVPCPRGSPKVKGGCEVVGAGGTSFPLEVFEFLRWASCCSCSRRSRFPGVNCCGLGGFCAGTPGGWLRIWLFFCKVIANFWDISARAFSIWSAVMLNWSATS